jgi:hypothetical protein
MEEMDPMKEAEKDGTTTSQRTGTWSTADSTARSYIP